MGAERRLLGHNLGLGQIKTIWLDSGLEYTALASFHHDRSALPGRNNLVNFIFQTLNIPSWQGRFPTIYAKACKCRALGHGHVWLVKSWHNLPHKLTEISHAD